MFKFAATLAIASALEVHVMETAQGDERRAVSHAIREMDRSQMAVNADTGIDQAKHNGWLKALHAQIMRLEQNKTTNDAEIAKLLPVTHNMKQVHDVVAKVIKRWNDDNTTFRTQLGWGAWDATSDYIARDARKA